MLMQFFNLVAAVLDLRGHAASEGYGLLCAVPTTLVFTLLERQLGGLAVFNHRGSKCRQLLLLLRSLGSLSVLLLHLLPLLAQLGGGQQGEGLEAGSARQAQGRHEEGTGQHRPGTIQRRPDVQQDALDGVLVLQVLGHLIALAAALVVVVVNHIAHLLSAPLHDPVMPIKGLWMPQQLLEVGLGGQVEGAAHELEQGGPLLCSALFLPLTAAAAAAGHRPGHARQLLPLQDLAPGVLVHVVVDRHHHLRVLLRHVAQLPLSC
mmetsp:Transcript_3950/g.5884  ORF Transcript_3950/g.5884 Transcript_3950/m.5884 type:complete len:263 (-) Transcript_3950:150-938(-)